jgi:hypothetical protein
VYDHLFVNSLSTVGPMAQVSGVPTTWLPPGVDVERFGPGDRQYERVIDVANLGRRMPGTHRALLDLSRTRGLFYLYDDVLGGSFDSASGHRDWLADVLLRTRYNIANYARCDQPDWTRGVREMGSRFVEGAAAGTVMLGAPPDPAPLLWEDAVIPLPVDAPDVADALADLDRDPERVARIRRRNVANALRSHDWVYRWQQILEAADLVLEPAAARRMERLAAEAERWERE